MNKSINKIYIQYINDMENENLDLISSFMTGSRLYGTFSETSDYDIRGVFIPSKKTYLGFLDNLNMKRYEDKEKDVDFEFMEIHKFLQLCLDNNPNIIEYLFIPNMYTFHNSKEWEMIVDHRNYFLSKKAKYTFTGYAISQIKRLKRHRNWLLTPPKQKPIRQDYGLPNTRSALTSDQIGAYNQLVCLYLKQIGKSHKLYEELSKMEETFDYMSILNQSNTIDYRMINEIYPTDTNFLKALDKEKRYGKDMKEWKLYCNWKNQRNPRRKVLEENFGYDTKHMMHCFRLLSEGKELLLTGNITFPRPDNEFLMEIRDGKYKYEELIEKVETIELSFNEFYEQSTLPKKPNRNKINDLIVNILSDKYGL